MAKVLYDNIVFMQEGWKKDCLPEAADMIALTNKLMHRLIDNGHKLDGISLRYPEDCNNYNVFRKVAYGLGATVTGNGHGFIMTDFCNNCDLEVE